jgi:hypothetical protein
MCRGGPGSTSRSCEVLHYLVAAMQHQPPAYRHHRWASALQAEVLVSAGVGWCALLHLFTAMGASAAVQYNSRVVPECGQRGQGRCGSQRPVRQRGVVSSCAAVL